MFLSKLIESGMIVSVPKYSPCRAAFRWPIVLLIGLAAAEISAGAAASSGKIEFNRDIRPILSENCFACHGADSASRKASLRLDRFDDAIAPREKSKPAIVPGKPDESELVRRIFTSDSDDLMPPAKTHKVLKPEQKEILKRWIADGAKYQAHWSLLAPTRPALPPVKDEHWVRNPIDNFILSRLEQENLKPAPEADRRTLARRVSLDLIGLPPKPDDVEAFVKDTSPEAYEKFVDELLASPHWGEHRGRYWLDAARYADTHGIHVDNYREMWFYRNWVIDAFNKNEHFDQFTIEQLAGDLLPKPTLEQQIATGFNRCNITTSEGGAIDDEYLALYTRDRTETTSQVWLGLTAGCAVCHDHKFDRLSQKEFYSMSAFFNNTTQKAMDGNIKNTPPIIVVPKAEDRPRWEALPSAKKTANKKIEDRRKFARKDFNSWSTNTSAEKLLGRLPSDTPAFRARLADNEKQTISISVEGKTRTLALATNAAWQDGAVAEKAFTTSARNVPEIPDAGDFARDQEFSYAAWVHLDASDRDGALFARMDNTKKHRGWDFWIEAGKPATHIIHDWPEDALKTMSKKAVETNRWTHVCITYDGSSKAAGVKIYIDGDAQEVDYVTDKLKNSIRTKVPLKIGQRHSEAELEKAGVQDIRLYERALKPEEVKELARSSRMAWLFSKPVKARTDGEKKELYTDWLNVFDEEFQKRKQALAKLDEEENQIKGRGVETHVMHERDEKAEAFVLFRGEYDKRRDKVSPATPSAMPSMPEDFPRNRLGFARWLLLPEHPLTARVTVNRFWQEVFGTGLVKTSGDLGVSGEMPSHPELLDWLAVEFRESWDIKKFFKLIVTSATYRQAAMTTPEKISKDPQNRLLSRGPRFRMDAEMVRDYALAASGLLVPKIGGPSVKPYQPDGVWEAVAMIDSNTRNYQRDSGENLYRRSLYTFWKRSAPPATMDIFNAPSREGCTVRRERTDTPLQALVTLNDPQFIEAARNLAQSAITKGGKKETDRIDFIAEHLLTRPLQSKERKIIERSLKDLLAYYKKTPKDATALITIGESKPDEKLEKPTLAAYTMVANEMMNLDEVLNK